MPNGYPLANLAKCLTSDCNCWCQLSHSSLLHIFNVRNTFLKQDWTGGAIMYFIHYQSDPVLFFQHLFQHHLLP